MTCEAYDGIVTTCVSWNGEASPNVTQLKVNNAQNRFQDTRKHIFTLTSFTLTRSYISPSSQSSHIHITRTDEIPMESTYFTFNRNLTFSSPHTYERSNENMCGSSRPTDTRSSSDASSVCLRLTVRSSGQTCGGVRSERH